MRSTKPHHAKRITTGIPGPGRAHINVNITMCSRAQYMRPLNIESKNGLPRGEAGRAATGKRHRGRSSRVDAPGIDEPVKEDHPAKPDRVFRCAFNFGLVESGYLCCLQCLRLADFGDCGGKI